MSQEGVRLVRCADLAAYAERAAERGGGIPVLGDGGAHDEALARDLAASPVQRGRGGDVVLGCADDAHPLAAALARWTGRRLVTCGADLDVLESCDARTIAIVALHAAFTFNVLERIARVSARPGGPAVGIVTARSLAALSRRIARAAFARPRPAGRTVRLGGLAAADAPRDDRTTFEEPIDIALALTHGSSIDMDLKIAVLCGRSAQARPATSYPCRVGRGCKRTPEGDRLLIRAEELGARVLFAESCNGVALAGGLYPDDLTMALSAMDGAMSAYISTYKLVRASGGLLAAVADALLDAGYEFGDVTSLVNRAQEKLTLDVPSFVLVGDPCDRIERPARPAAAPATAVERLPATVDVDGGGAIDRTFEVTLVLGAEAARALDGARLRVELTPPPGPDERGYALLLAGGHGATTCTLLVCAEAPRRFDAIRFGLMPDDAESVRSVVASVRAACLMLDIMLGGLATFPKPNQATERCVAELSEIVDRALRLVDLAAESADRPPHLAPFDAATVSLEMLVRLCGDLASVMIDAFPSWGLSSHIAWMYDRAIRPRGGERSLAPCEVCGSPSFAIDYVRAAQPALGRVVIHCARCGILSDGPAGVPPPRLEGAFRVRAGERARIVVRAVRSEARHIRPAVSAFIAHAPAALGCTIEPAADPPAAANEFAAAFDIAADTDVLPGVYNLVIVASELLDLRIAARPFRIDPLTST